jgi:putative membrane-bound dehydrogenase-like protein
MMIVVLLSMALIASDEHLSPQQSLSKIKLPPGLVVELAAHEPNVESPVAISFDEHGRMFVAEYRDYPIGRPKGEPPLSRIRLLEDADADGFFEKATIYADRLSFAQGVLAYNGGVIVTAAPHILFLKDTNGDGVADEKKIWFTGFKEGNPQLRVSHPKLGLDHMVYVANGLSGGEIRRGDGTGLAIKLDRDDFRFDPRTLKGEATTGFGQFGNTFDDWGRRFTCSNRNPVIHCFLPKRILNRNDQIPIAVGYGDVAPSGSDSRVYPIASTETTAESHAGTHTAACGVHIYRGDLLGNEFRGDVFVCEPTGFLVTRSKLIPQGAGFRTERDRPNEDFMASTDRWFRPVSLADGPDGALYVVDMHREVIEHPAYLPKGVGANLRFRAGAEKGRILRIKPKDAKAKPYMTPTDAHQLAALLNDDNGWRRDVAQRLMIERKFDDAVPELRRLARGHNMLAAIHAVWTLRALDLLTVETVLTATASRDQALTAEALLAARELIPSNSPLRDRVVELAGKTSTQRLQLNIVLVLGDFDHPKKIDALGRMACNFALHHDSWIPRAVFAAAAGKEGELLESLIRYSSVRSTLPWSNEIISQLCAAAVHRDERQLGAVLRLIPIGVLGVWTNPALVGLERGFRKPNPWKAKSLAEFLESPPKSLEREAKPVIPVLTKAETGAFDRSPSNPPALRRSAIDLAATRPSLRRKLLDLIGGEEPADVQVAVLNAIPHDDVASPVEAVVAKWGFLPPSVQSAAVDFSFKRRDSQLQFLKAIEAKKVPASAVGFERREMMLVFSGDQELKSLAKKLFGAVSSNRTGLIEQYARALKNDADKTKGAEVFNRVCASCHRLKGIGLEVGPPLADIRQKTKETLLTDILDPNRTFEPRFGSSVAILKDGRTVVGLLTTENAGSITLKQANGKDETIARDEIETMRSSGRSLMPEGVEKDVTPAQMNDLIEFLKAPN